jgi:hypothetical protein
MLILRTGEAKHFANVALRCGGPFAPSALLSGMTGRPYSLSGDAGM